MSADRRKFILLGENDQSENLVSVFNGEVVESAQEGCDFILAENTSFLTGDLPTRPIILSTEPDNFSKFIQNNGEVSINPSLLNNDLAKALLLNYSKVKKGIYQSFTLNKLLEYQNSFKVIDFSRLGFYADIIHLEAHEKDFHPVKIRTFLDLTLMFFNYLVQEGEGSFPVELDLGRNEKSFILSATIRNQNIDKNIFSKMFQPVKSKSNENSLLSLICSATDLLDIQVDKKSIKISGLWEKGHVKKQSSLIFLYKLDRSVKDEELGDANTYDPELESLDKENHYQRLAGIKNKDLPYEDLLEESEDFEVSAKFLEELALYTFKTLKPQFLNDLNTENLLHVLEGFPEQNKVKNLEDNDYERVIELIKLLRNKGDLVQKNNGSLDLEMFSTFLGNTSEDDFIYRVKGFIESEDPYMVATGFVDPELDTLVGKISVDYLDEERIIVKGRHEELEETISNALNFSKEIDGADHWVVKSLAQYLSVDDIEPSELENKIKSFLTKVKKASENKSINDAKPQLQELSDGWQVKSLPQMKDDVVKAVSDLVEGGDDEGDKAIEALSDLLLMEDDQLGNEEALLSAANKKLDKEKKFYKRTSEEDKKQIISLKEEIEILKETIRRKDTTLRKEEEFARLLKEDGEGESTGRDRHEEFEREASSNINEVDQIKLQEILKKAMALNNDLMEAEKVIRQMKSESNRKQIYYNKEIEKALRKSQASQNIANKAKEGLIRVANTNHNEIKSLKRNLDRVQNELMNSNGRNLTRIKELEKENHALSASESSTKSRLEVIQSKYEKLLKESEKFDSNASVYTPEKAKAIEERLNKTQAQLQQALTLGKGLQSKLTAYEFHEQKNMQKMKELERTVSKMKKNEKQLLVAAGKQINPETGELEGNGESGKDFVENRDKLIKANSKVLDLKKRLHAVERDRDNFLRKLKALEKNGGSRTHASPSDSVPKAQHDRLEESFKLVGEDFKKVAGQLESSRKEVNELKTQVRTMEAEKQKMEDEIAKIKKRNAA